MIHQREHLIDKKKHEQGEIWSINPLLSVTQKLILFSHLFALLL